MKTEFNNLSTKITFKKHECDMIDHEINKSDAFTSVQKIFMKRQLHEDFIFVSAVINTTPTKEISDLIGLIFYNAHEVIRDVYSKELTLLADICQYGEYYKYDDFCYHNLTEFIFAIVYKDLDVSQYEGNINPNFYTLIGTSEKDWYYKKYNIENNYENRKIYDYINMVASYDHDIHKLNFMKKITELEHEIPTNIVESVEALSNINKIILDFEKQNLEKYLKERFKYISLI